MELKQFILSLVVSALAVSIFPLPLLLIIVLVAILYFDADLTLIGCTKFGNKPDVLKGQVIWITGASSGIGEHLAYDLAKIGCKLILSARREDELERVKAKCAELSPSGFKDAHSVVKLDIVDYESHSKCVAQVMEKYDRIDVLVNNAGRSQRGEAMNTSLEVDKAVLDLNTVGTISLTKAVLPQMVKQTSGMVVVVSSIAGKLGAPCSAAYSASKHALQGFFATLRMELSGTGVGIQLVCPGPVISEVSANAFSTDKNIPVAVGGNTAAQGMSTARCTELMVVAMANRLHEVWISPQPVLIFAYIAQYMPSIATWIGQWIGPNRVKSFRKNSPSGAYSWSAFASSGSD